MKDYFIDPFLVFLYIKNIQIPVILKLQLKNQRKKSSNKNYQKSFVFNWENYFVYNYTVD